MITYIVAMFDEAKPLIDKYRMKKVSSETFYQYFTGDGAELVLTGIGYTNVIRVLSRHFSIHSPNKSDISINFGISGSTIPDSVGKLYYVNSIYDNIFDKYFYPDMLFKNDFLKAQCTTHIDICRSEEELKIESELVDEEASAVYESLISFFSPDRLFFFKVVSDIIGNDTDFKNLDAVGLIGSHINEVSDFGDFVQRFYSDYYSTTEVISESDLKLVSEISDTLRLTESMKQNLLTHIRYRKLNGCDFEDIIRNYLEKDYSEYKSKSEFKEVFDELTEKLRILDKEPPVAVHKFYEQLNPGFTNVYVEKSIDLSLTGFDLKGRNIIRINNYKEVFNRTHQNIELQKLSQSLILTENHGNFIYHGADVCQDFGNDNFYYCSTVMNCIFNCDYCYLQGLYPTGNIAVSVNIEDCFKELDKLLEDKSIYLCISYDTDLLAMEKMLGYVSRFIKYASEHPNITIEVRTKFGNGKLFDNFTTADNVIFAWTLSPDCFKNDIESKASPLNARLEASKCAINKGFKTRICIDPIICCYDWKNKYRKLVENVFENIKPQDIYDLSLGVFRISTDYLKLIRKRRPCSVCISYPFISENKVSHYGELSDEMISFVRSEVMKYYPENKIYTWDDKGVSYE